MKLKTISIALLPLILAVACATKVGQLSPPPKPSSANPSKITVYRDSDIVGSPVTMVFNIDGVETYGLKQGQSYSFRLDPGEYVFGFFLGLNECRQVLWFKQGKDYRIKLSPTCNFGQEEL